MDSPRQTVTTRLVHRRGRTDVPWWRAAAICDLPGSFDEADLSRVQKFLPDVAALGFQAVLLRPATPRVDVGLANLPDFVAQAHDLDLKVIVRAFLSGDEAALHPETSPPVLTLEHDTEELTKRARAILATGADGVDLGLVNDEQGSPDAAANSRAFTEAIQVQLAEVELAGETTILTAAIISDSQEAAMHHLTEDWFHHLRDDTLVSCPWNAAELQRRVQQAFVDRDPLGHTAAWRYSLPKWTSSPYTRSSADYGWADSRHADAREVAMMLYTVSLPGAAYVPFLHVGGGIKPTKGKDPGLKFFFEKGRAAQLRANVAHEALSIRNRLGLGESTLAFVDGLDWCNEDTPVHLSGPIMVVLNMGKSTIVVPPEHRPVLSSRGMMSTSDKGTIVRPNCCVWLQTAELEPARPTAYR